MVPQELERALVVLVIIKQRVANLRIEEKAMQPEIVLCVTASEVNCNGARLTKIPLRFDGFFPVSKRTATMTAASSGM